MIQQMLTAGPAYLLAMNPQRTNMPLPIVPPTPMLTRSNRVRCRGMLLVEVDGEDVMDRECSCGQVPSCMEL